MHIRTKMSQLPPPELSAGDRALLFALAQSEAYRVLLDVLHRFVVGEETQLINTNPGQEAEVLAQWHNARACWAMFARMQYEVAQASLDYAEGAARAEQSRESVRDFGVGKDFDFG